MNKVIEQQIAELRAFMPLNELQMAYIMATLEIVFAEGEAEQMRKQLNNLKNGN
jgi:hypothetical protein